MQLRVEVCSYSTTVRYCTLIVRYIPRQSRTLFEIFEVSMCLVCVSIFAFLTVYISWICQLL